MIMVRAASFSVIMTQRESDSVPTQQKELDGKHLSVWYGGIYLLSDGEVVKSSSGYSSDWNICGGDIASLQGRLYPVS